MRRYRGVASHRGGIPAHIQTRLLKMTDIDGCWVGISPRKGLRRARIIALDRQREEVQRLASRGGLSQGDYALFQVARKSLRPGEGPDQAFEAYERLNWRRWMGGQF